MKLTITHLKAPWPAGAKVGDVIELASVPSWAAGKFVLAPDDAQPAETVGETAPSVDDEEASIAKALAAANQQAAQERAQINAHQKGKKNK